jgi:hypothetical protein
MTIDEVKRANELLRQIEELQRRIGIYREATDFKIGVVDAKNPLFPHRCSMTAKEICDALVTVLEERRGIPKDELKSFGIEE